GVVEVRRLGVRDDVVRAVRDRPRPERILGRPELHELDLLDAAVAVAPLAADDGDAVVSLQVDQRVGPPGQELGRARRSCSAGSDGDHASTFTTKYRNGSETSVNWCGVPFGIASTSPVESSCASPPSISRARTSP